MAEHDQRFKQLLKEFFPDLLLLFFPEQAARLDFREIEWLDKEIFPDATAGDVYQLDLVARLRRRPDAGVAAPPELLTLVHVEVESRDAVATFRQRMYQYYEALRREYGHPVLPIAVYLRVGLDGIGIDQYAEVYDELNVLTFRFLYVGLPGLDAEEYVRGGNWLGVALTALMGVPRSRKAWVRGEALRRVLLECRESEFRRFLLRECVEAYAELDEQQIRELEQLLQTDRYKEVRPMMKTTWEKGVEEGLTRGLTRGHAEGQRALARSVLEQRFGPLSPEVLERLNVWPLEQLPLLFSAAPGSPALREIGLEAGE
jgi:hypothetical protein